MNHHEADPALAFRHAAAEYLVDIASAAAVVDGAIALLSTGAASPSLLEIGSADPTVLRRAQLTELIEQALTDLGHPPMATAELAVVRTRGIAEKICSGRLEPVQGANALWSGRTVYGDPYRILGELIELVDEWESEISRRSIIASRITTIACDITRS